MRLQIAVEEIEILLVGLQRFDELASDLRGIVSGDASHHRELAAEHPEHAEHYRSLAAHHASQASLHEAGSTSEELAGIS
ncbi:MAG TPA: hypothetical protein VEN81_13125 [Planctomycetota bacterium]|nr:hypothetical protein [Planctomycetota bacterium]